MPVEATRPRRGPRPNPDRGTPSGYRITDRTRFEMGMAARFLGTRSLQDTIDHAVSELLSQMRNVDGFQAALASAEAHMRQRAAVRSLPSSSSGHTIKGPGG